MDDEEVALDFFRNDKNGYGCYKTVITKVKDIFKAFDNRKCEDCEFSEPYDEHEDLIECGEGVAVEIQDDKFLVPPNFNCKYYCKKI